MRRILEDDDELNYPSGQKETNIPVTARNDSAYRITFADQKGSKWDLEQQNKLANIEVRKSMEKSRSGKQSRSQSALRKSNISPKSAVSKKSRLSSGKRSHLEQDASASKRSHLEVTNEDGQIV